MLNLLHVAFPHSSASPAPLVAEGWGEATHRRPRVRPAPSLLRSLSHRSSVYGFSPNFGWRERQPPSLPACLQDTLPRFHLVMLLAMLPVAQHSPPPPTHNFLAMGLVKAKSNEKIDESSGSIHIQISDCKM